MRIATAAIVILGGSALMYWLHTLTPVSIAVYVALAPSASGAHRAICVIK